MEELAAAPYNGRADLPALDQALGLGTEEMLHLVEALRLLKFAEVAEGDIQLTTAGKIFADADTQKRKQIFAEHLLQNVPLVAYVCRVLQSRPGNHAPRIRFITQLEDHMPEEDAIEALSAVTSWGRYAEVFAYDDNTETYSLEEIRPPRRPIGSAELALSDCLRILQQRLYCRRSWRCCNCSTHFVTG